MRLSRRDFLVAGAGMLGAGMFPRLMAGEPVVPRPRARAVIQIWMWGGMSHLDTFDPKPGAGRDFHGPSPKPIATRHGYEISALLPRLAAISDHYALLRGLTHGNNGHETAAYLTQTGRLGEGGPSFPGMSAVVPYALGALPGCALPPSITLTRSLGRFDEAGFLGAGAKPYVTGGNPAKEPFLVDGLVADGVDEDRQRVRRELLSGLDHLPGRLSRTLAERRAEADALILGDAGKAFTLSSEPDAVRDRYGRNEFGQSCLCARRLVEAGVRYVTINSQGWDMHKGIFPDLARRLPEVDAGLATLLEDLGQRGLLDRTIVWLGGEFGRTPRISWEAPWNGGRGHHGKAFSGLLAGGGFRGGSVVGATDETGTSVRERPILPWDLLASISDRLGIERSLTLPLADGSTLPWAPETVPNLLREIMT